ncbi:hypothetical protein F7725_025305 [Dissostichus mawsoni]|uniref:Uncharacterized protein n=1 Tax=Dissostichus mawsoni TaxID=36200 RepID=A0A7J5XB03_DISMA|nr:hypothetical protein F7725_025305 [Dissostichus mawsoni]
MCVLIGFKGNLPYPYNIIPERNFTVKTNNSWGINTEPGITLVGSSEMNAIVVKSNLKEMKQNLFEEKNRMN